MSDQIVRVSKSAMDRLREACSQHPLQPSLKATVERGIDLVIKEMKGNEDE